MEYIYFIGDKGFIIDGEGTEKHDLAYWGIFDWKQETINCLN